MSIAHEIIELQPPQSLLHSVDDDFNVYPYVSADIFQERPEAAFWVGAVASQGSIQRPDYYDGVTVFRGNKYVKEFGWLPHSVLDAQGRETDQDDSRSIVFAAVENLVAERSARIVGSGRLIIKEDVQQKLPIEIHFPEIFENNPVAAGDVEVSRFIADHPDVTQQHMLAVSLIRAFTLASVNRDAGYGYMMIERPVKVALKFLGLELESLGEPKDVDELGGVLYPVRINPKQVVETITTDRFGKLDLRSFFTQGVNSDGEGYLADKVKEYVKL